MEFKEAATDMPKFLLVLSLLCATAAGYAATPGGQPAWKSKMAAQLPLLGHRNWILVVDSAYPLQSSPGVETIETNASQIEVVRAVLDAVHHSAHVRPLIYMDSELSFVPDEDAPGASAYRAQIADLLKNSEITRQPHESLISLVGEAGKTFHVLVLKTTMTIPYSSVFIRLDCRYWSAEAEQRMRARMNAAKP